MGEQDDKAVWLTPARREAMSLRCDAIAARLAACMEHDIEKMRALMHAADRLEQQASDLEALQPG